MKFHFEDEQEDINLLEDDELDSIKSEDSSTQLNLFKDKVAEKDATNIGMFAANFLAKFVDKVNSAYKAIVKNMPATDEQKKTIPMAAFNFNEDYTKLGNFGRVMTKWTNTKVRNCHEPSLKKAIDSTIKSNINKFNGKQFTNAKLSGTSITIEITPEIAKYLQELSKKL